MLKTGLTKRIFQIQQGHFTQLLGAFAAKIQKNTVGFQFIFVLLSPSIQATMEKPKFVIAINREFGSGGREIAYRIGELLADNINMQFPFITK